MMKRRGFLASIAALLAARAVPLVGLLEEESNVVAFTYKGYVVESLGGGAPGTLEYIGKPMTETLQKAIINWLERFDSEATWDWLGKESTIVARRIGVWRGA
jgi:hypothetical protein